MSRKYFIIGYYGSSNFGDELLLKATKDLILKSDPSAQLRALTYNVKETFQKHGIKGVSRNHFADIIKEIRVSDVIVGGGGSMLQNVTSNRSLIYYLMLLFIAKFSGKKTILLGNGIGPIEGKLWCFLSASLLKKLDAIVVRDEASYETLLKLGVKSNVELGSDLVFSHEVHIHLEEVKEKVSLNLRPWKNQATFMPIFEQFTHYLLDEGYEVQLIPFQKGYDDLLLEDLKNRVSRDNVSILNSEDVNEILQEISNSQIFLGMRLHSLILSAIAETPFIGLSYDPKVDAFSESMRQPHITNLENLTLEALKEQFLFVKNNQSPLVSKLTIGKKEAVRLSELNLKVLNKVLNKSL
jgi:polysaccharide pyruvyl transferase CsaB